MAAGIAVGGCGREHPLRLFAAALCSWAGSSHTPSSLGAAGPSLTAAAACRCAPLSALQAAKAPPPTQYPGVPPGGQYPANKHLAGAFQQQQQQQNLIRSNSAV